MKKLFCSFLVLFVTVTLVSFSACSNVGLSDPPANDDQSAPADVTGSQFIIFSVAADATRSIDQRTNIPAFMWITPDSEDFDGVRVVRKNNEAPQSPDDGEIVYEGNSNSCVDRALAQSQEEGNWVYRIYTYDRAGNFSPGVIVNRGAVLYVTAEVIEEMNAQQSSSRLLSSRSIASLFMPKWGISGIISGLCDNVQAVMENTVNSVKDQYSDAMGVASQTVKKLYNEAKEIQNQVCSNVDCAQIGVTLFNYGAQFACAALGVPVSPYITPDGHLGIAVGVPGGPTMVYDVQDGSVQANMNGVWVEVEDGNFEYGFDVDFGVASISFDSATGNVSISALNNGFRIACYPDDGSDAVITNVFMNGGQEEVVMEVSVAVTGVEMSHMNVNNFMQGATEPYLTFFRTYGGPNTDAGKCVRRTADGGYIVGGTTPDVSGTTDIWIVKTDFRGTVQWNRSFGTAAKSENVFDIKQTIDGGYIVVGTARPTSTDRDVWLIKLDASGNIEWQTTYGSVKADEPVNVFVTSDGGYVVGAWSWGLGAGQIDAWIFKVNSEGAMVWQHTYGWADFDNVYGFAETSDGGFVFVGDTSSLGASNGMWFGKLNSEGVMEWQRTYPGFQGHRVHQTSDGGYIVSGIKAYCGGLSCLMRLDSSGTMLWNNLYGGSGNDYCTTGSVIQLSDGGFAFSGYTSSIGEGGDDAWLVRTDSNGNMSWQQSYGGIQTDRGYGMVLLGDESFVMTGAVNVNGNNELFLLRTDPDGNLQ